MLLKKMEAQDFFRREKNSSNDLLKKALPTSRTVKMKEQVAGCAAYYPAGKTANGRYRGRGVRDFSDVLKKMQENMELTEKEAGYG